MLYCDYVTKVLPKCYKALKGAIQSENWKSLTQGITIIINEIQ